MVLEFILLEMKMPNEDFCFAEETRFESGQSPLKTWLNIKAFHAKLAPK
jgi:hypothetical protein